MATFTVEQVRTVAQNPENIRNFCIAAQIDAGKSTLSDSLLCHAGLISKKDAGDKRQTDTMKQEQERGITIKAVGVTMCIPHDNHDYVFGLVDSPGHLDFSSEVSCSVRVSDGALVLIDTIDGVKAQTRTVLSQILVERVKPVLVINKIDKMFLSLKLTPEEIYRQFIKNIEDVNYVIDEYQDPLMATITKDQKVNPVIGDVVFAAAYQTWGFSLKTFAKKYSEKMKKAY
jgi:elongation factor 2